MILGTLDEGNGLVTFDSFFGLVQCVVPDVAEEENEDSCHDSGGDADGVVDVVGDRHPLEEGQNTEATND